VTRRMTQASESKEWETPQKLFDQLDTVFHFDLDVAATAANAKCPRYYDIEMDGLRQCWHQDGTSAWMNNPYGEARITETWLRKAIYESFAGLPVVALEWTKTETSWFQDLVFGRASYTCFIRGRLSFSSPDAPHATTARTPSVLAVYLPPGMTITDEQMAVLKSLGKVVES
jgi:phage N-6-adenine-methyltransferase